MKRIAATAGAGRTTTATTAEEGLIKRLWGTLFDRHPRHPIQKNPSAKCNLPEASGQRGRRQGNSAANAAGAAVTALQKDAILHSVTVTTSPATTPDPGPSDERRNAKNQESADGQGKAANKGREDGRRRGGNRSKDNTSARDVKQADDQALTTNKQLPKHRPQSTELGRRSTFVTESLRQPSGTPRRPRSPG